MFWNNSDCDAVINEFLKEYPGFSSLEFKIRKYSWEIYDDDSEEIKNSKAAYHPAKGIITLISSNVSSSVDIRRTLRHELIGHYGLNTLKAQEKLNFLTNVLRLSEDINLDHRIRSMFDKIRKTYKEKPKLVIAEEMFCLFCEAELQRDVKFGLSNNPLAKNSMIEMEDIYSLILDMEIGFKNNSRTQQIFPRTDHDQFKIEFTTRMT